MFDQLLNLFGQSPQGQQAYSALQAQGYSPTQSAGILTTAFPAAVSAMQNAMQSNNGQLGLLDIKNSNYAMNFLTGAVSGLVRGQGMKGAAVDGLQSVVGGHVAQVIASRCGAAMPLARKSESKLAPFQELVAGLADASTLVTGAVLNEY